LVWLVLIRPEGGSGIVGERVIGDAGSRNERSVEATAGGALIAE
jgi:hypothetical protein